MGETDKPPQTSPWPQQTVGERMVTAAWRAVAAHLAEQPADVDERSLPPANCDRLR